MPKKDSFKTFYAISFAWQLGFFIAIPISGFLFLGFWGDRFFKTQPFLLIFGIFVGAIVAVYEVYHLLIPLIKNDDNKK